MSIDLEKIKKMSIIDMGDWSEISGLDPLEWDEIIQALSEAKEIIENLKETSRTYAMQTYSKVAHKSADTADEWLSRYFPDTRKEG